MMPLYRGQMQKPKANMNHSNMNQNQNPKVVQRPRSAHPVNMLIRSALQGTFVSDGCGVCGK